MNAIKYSSLVLIAAHLLLLQANLVTVNCAAVSAPVPLNENHLDKSESAYDQTTSIQQPDNNNFIVVKQAEQASAELIKPAIQLMKPAPLVLSSKAEKLLKGLSSLMNPALNPAAYFVPSSPGGQAKQAKSRKSAVQKTDNSSDSDHAQQAPNEPSALVNMQATSEGIVSAPTRMARPQNYIFRWGRR